MMFEIAGGVTALLLLLLLLLLALLFKVNEDGGGEGNDDDGDDAAVVDVDAVVVDVETTFDCDDDAGDVEVIMEESPADVDEIIVALRFVSSILLLDGELVAFFASCSRASACVFFFFFFFLDFLVREH